MIRPIWENFISLNSDADFFAENIGRPKDYIAQDDGSVQWDRTQLSLDAALAADTSVLPSTEAREGYYGANHFNYWASGIADYLEIIDWANRNNHKIRTCLDIGCASGRVIRALDTQGKIKTYACDINRRHIDWINANLPRSVTAFQNHSIPSLPLPDRSLDLVTAFSVFTHIEAFETAWLMEIKRILRPGGIAWLTIHGDRTWREVEAGWPLHAAMITHSNYLADKERSPFRLPKPRQVYRWEAERSYASNVFYTYDYVKNVWGRYMDVVEIKKAIPPYQDVVILRAS